MGAETFVTKAKGATAREAFQAAIQQAQWQHGHNGYTGTITEKIIFVRFRPLGRI
jgi:fatty acid/phospholipid biosynthesis enzyme